MLHPGLVRVLAHREAVASETVHWPGDMRLEMTTFLGEADLPVELVVSVRCVVTVKGRVLVCEDATPNTDILPGGRCEPGESWQQTAQREVLEETGWHVEPGSLQMLGFIQFRHVTPLPAEHRFPHPDFLQVVMHGEATGAPVGWVDVEGWVQRSWLASFEQARSLPLSAAGTAFLALVDGRA